MYSLGFPGGSEGKTSTCNVGDSGLIPGSGRSPGEGKPRQPNIFIGNSDNELLSSNYCGFFMLFFTFQQDSCSNIFHEHEHEVVFHIKPLLGYI